MYKKLEKKTLIISFAILLTTLIITSSFLLTIFDESFISKKSKSIENKEIVLSNFMNYLQDKTDHLSEAFNVREKEHMQDVKDIIQTTNSVNLFSLISLIAITFSLIHKKQYKILKTSLKYSTISSFSTILLLILGVLNFQIFFNKFHELFFKPGTWLFYSTDTLIRLFPFNFFQTAFIKIILTSLVFSCIILTLTIIFNSYSKRKSHNLQLE